jgi:hypothetical protein
MWRFLTIFPPNMATFATKFRKNHFGQLARDFLNLFMWLYKNSPEKKERRTLLPSSYGWMTTGRRFWNQKKKIKNCGEISKLGEFFFQKLKGKKKKICDF